MKKKISDVSSLVLLPDIKNIYVDYFSEGKQCCDIRALAKAPIPLKGSRLRKYKINKG